MKDAKQRTHMANPPSESKPSVDVPRETPVQGDPKTYPPNLFSGQQRRLQFEGGKPGYRYRIFNDEGPNIGMALRSGWQFASSEGEGAIVLVEQVVPSNKDVGTKVCFEVGHNAAGHPLYAYVMEKPEWLCEEHETGPGSREEYHQQLEAQIRAGTLGQKANDGRYTPNDPRAGTIMRGQRISVSTQTVKTTTR